MNNFRYMDEIKAPEAWKTTAKDLWAGAPTERKNVLRLLRPLPLAAVLACLLIGTALAAVVISSNRNPIIVENGEELQSVDAELEDTAADGGYGISVPAAEQKPLAFFVEGATYTADHWQEKMDFGYTLLSTKGEQDWMVDGYESESSPFWERYGSSSDGWTLREYVAEAHEALNEADPASVTFDVSLADAGLLEIPYGNRLDVIKDKNGALLGVSAKLCWRAGDERYFQLDYSFEANAIDWGTSFVTRDAFDEAVEYTTQDGREFVITTYQDRLWAESVTPTESYHFYAIGISIEEAETMLENISVTVHA